MNFGDKIRVKDNLANNLDESSVSYKLYDTTGGGERLLTAEFDEAQKQFVIENPEIKSVRLTVLASDKSGNAGSTSLDITMLPLLDYGAFDFSGFEAGALADKPISGLSFSGFSKSDLKEIAFDESENKNILKLHIAESPVKQAVKDNTRWATVRFTKICLAISRRLLRNFAYARYLRFHGRFCRVRRFIRVSVAVQIRVARKRRVGNVSLRFRKYAGGTWQNRYSPYVLQCIPIKRKAAITPLKFRRCAAVTIRLRQIARA